MILGPGSRPLRPADDLSRGYPGAVVDGPFAWLEITAVAAVATAVLVFVLLMVSLNARNRLIALHREQLDELVRLREELTRARQDDAAIEEVPRIGAPEPVFQIGDRVAIVDGPHSGDHGTVVPTPEWVRQGFVCVELLRERGKRYMPVAKLSRLDEPAGP